MGQCNFEFENNGNYGTSGRTIEIMLDKKLKMGVDVMQQWPQFVCFEEDFVLWLQQWKAKYGQK